MLYQKLSQCNILLTFLSPVAIMGLQEDNKPFMYSLPLALADEWNEDAHRQDELQTQAKQIER